jgi:ribosomal-protein-alanine N-acetyltransferase
MYENWAKDPAVSRWMRWLPHESPQATREYLQTVAEGYADSTYYHWAIQRKEDGVLMGSIGVLYLSEGKGEPECWNPGYCIGHAFWGHGYTAEALQAVLAHLAPLVDNQLGCCHAVNNPASGRVMQKAGFVYDHDGFYTGRDREQIPAKYYVYNPDAQVHS